MTDDDRDLIVELINAESNSYDGVVVTHGTDTLRDTITYVVDRIAAPACPIVFTCAMTPLAIHGSDAIQILVPHLWRFDCFALAAMLFFTIKCF